ncbi:MAG TPA: hypothetical protein VGP48_09715 [Stellaceae bacterium]|nr:hypothetical protein [Stellaceae bacterium]
MMLAISHAGPAMLSAFLASLVEAVEALTIVLAAAAVRDGRSAVCGASAGALSLAAAVVLFGPLLDAVPLRALQLAIGVLLLLFGMRWLRKAILRAAGTIPLRDEAAAYAGEAAELRGHGARHGTRLDWPAAIASFKAVLLEGLEVVFIVIAVGGADRSLLLPAGIGAGAAVLVIVLLGVIVQRPLARVPENALKFAVGVMLSAFGVFWTGEGLGVAWPGSDFAIVAFAGVFLLAGLATVAVKRAGREVLS